MKTTVVFRGDWIDTKFQSPKKSITGPSNGVPNLLSYGDFSVCQFVLYVSLAKRRSIPLFLTTTFLQDPTETEEKRYPLLLYGLFFGNSNGF